MKNEELERMRDELAKAYREKSKDLFSASAFQAGFDAALNYIQNSIDTNAGGNAKFGLLEGAFWGPYLGIAKFGLKIHHVAFGYPTNPVAVIDFVDAKRLEECLRALSESAGEFDEKAACRQSNKGRYLEEEFTA